MAVVTSEAGSTTSTAGAKEERLVASAYQLLDGGDPSQEQIRELWHERNKLPEIVGDSLEALAGDRFDVLFRAYQTQLLREQTITDLSRHSTDPQSFSPESRRDLLTKIDNLQQDEIFASLLQQHTPLLDHLRTSVLADTKVAAHGPDAVREGWVTVDELMPGKTYVTKGTQPFVVQRVTRDEDFVKVIVQDEAGYRAHLFKPDTLIAPERTAAWQAVAVENIARHGITPEGAALWFAAGELYRLTNSEIPAEAQRWNRLLSPYTQERTGESPHDFSKRILGRAYSGPIGQPGALEAKDVEDLRSLLLDLARDTGIDMVRLGVVGQRARFTSSLGWEQLNGFPEDQPKMFGQESSVRRVSAHGDAVMRAALWNHGVHILEHQELRHFQDVQRTAEVPTATLGRYVPKDKREESDSFSKALDRLKSKPTIELARKIVESHASTIERFLTERSVPIDSSLVLVAAPSSSQGTQLLTQAISELFADRGVTTREIFSKRTFTSRSGKYGDTDLAAVRSVKSAHNFYDRVTRAYSSTEITNSAGLKEGKNVLIVDDITTMGCTKDVCAMLMGHFKPQNVLFLAAGKTA